MHDPAFVVAPDGLVLGCNHAAARSLGIDAAEVEARPFSELVEDGERVWRTLETAFAAEAAGPLAVRLRRAGASLPCSMTAVASEAATHPCLLITAVPPGAVADAARELAAFRDTFRQLRTMLARAGARGFFFDEGAILVDLDGRVQYAAPPILDMLGQPSDGTIGTPIADLARLPGLAPLAAPEPFPDKPELLTVEHPDGAVRLVRHQACALFDAAGRRIGTLHTLRDETAVGAGSDELARKSRELDEARARLTRAQHLKALGELSAEVAHEFGNLLQAIGLQAAALRRQASLPEPVMRSVWSIKQAVDIGQALTRRLLTFARNSPEDQMSPIDIGRVLRDLVQLLEPRINMSGRSVRMELSLPPLPEVRGNENKLTEAFLNLFLNAMDAMPDGGTLRVSAAERSGEIRIAVHDTGKGMTPEEVSRAFDPFFTTKPGGTGLGLSTVYGVVRAHGGSVFVESEPGKGTTVFVSLPTTTPPEVGRRIVPRLPLREAGRVLVVDDHPTVREATSELLATQGYEVETAGSVAEALAALRRGRFSVVVTDVGLPDRPGWEVARAVKESSPGTAVLLVTGWGSHFSMEEARARGADMVFEKPVDPDVLLSAVGREAGRA
ncbi:MAG TPA: ATP-binding protein [Candidatus Binatia bacterium]|nr:ATP-binding protein [Candidatus Binatia bacterium]